MEVLWWCRKLYSIVKSLGDNCGYQSRLTDLIINRFFLHERLVFAAVDAVVLLYPNE